MQEWPGPPEIGGTGHRFMINAGLLKLHPQSQRPF